MTLRYVSPNAFCKLGPVAAQRYLKEFVETIPKRVDELTTRIHNTPGYDNWKADLSLASLYRLREWLIATVGSRRPSKAELKEDRDTAPSTIRKQLAYSGPSLKRDAELVAREVGTYCALMIAKQMPSSWGVVDKPKNDVELWTPVLFREPRVPMGSRFSPFAAGTVLSLQAADGTLTEDGLRTAYQIWIAKDRDPTKKKSVTVKSKSKRSAGSRARPFKPNRKKHK